MRVVHLLGDAGVLLGAVSATLFVFGYHATARWWRSQEGVHMMAFTAAMALSLDYSAVRLLAGNLPHLPPDVDVARTVVFDLVGVLLAWRLELLWQAQVRRALRDAQDRKKGSH